MPMRCKSISLIVILVGSRATAADDAKLVEFNREIRPILADVCYHCHGPDKGQRKANLRFDQEESAKAKVIIPGKPEKSELVRRISSTDPTVQMPPPNSGRKLTPEQRDTLRRWVEQGAKWQKHWAFIPPARPALPGIQNANFKIQNEVDHFILARLEKEGLSPSPEASKSTLIRRVTLDLTGLPPTPEEVDAFLKDQSAKAYEKVVDRLLASPRYGERMAWRWLEAARYADTHGYQTDGDRDMYRWRDWVIEAYNRNLPFDQFTIEQLAGDLLPNATLNQKIATGFNRNHRGNSEGGIIPEEYAVEYVVDRVETTATVWLGLTLGCARCHEHKYDPFSQREFYQLYAYFNSIPEHGRALKYGNSPPSIKAPTKEHERRIAELDKKYADACRDYAAQQAMSEGAEALWDKQVDPATVPDWNIDDGLVAHLSAGDTSRIRFREGNVKVVAGKPHKAFEFDGKGYADAGDLGNFGFNDKFTFSFWIKPRGKNGVILSRMVDEPRGEGYSIHLVDGKIQAHFTKRWLDDALRVESSRALSLDEWRHVVVSYDGSRTAAGVRIRFAGAGKTKTLLDELNQSFNTSEPLRLGAGGKADRFDGLLADLRIYRRLLDIDEIDVLSATKSVADILRTPEADRTYEEYRKLHYYFLFQAAPAKVRDSLRKVIESGREAEQYRESLPTVMIMDELPKPKDAFVLIRGQYDKPGEKVSRAVPAALNALPNDAPNNRLGLAKWLVDPANPLTARVAVNRMWQLHFGAGLVKTGEDFGTQGEYPSHPELLDWLATEFIRTGWDVKRMHKLIVMSATYRQSSKVTKELFARDPDNRLIARGPRFRLSAEMIRDQALATSGLLVEKLGGPSVKPYQPPGLWKELTGTEEYVQDKGEKLYRRSLYTYWKRTVAPPSLMSFDASTREFCSVRDSRTNTPLQALDLLNDVTYVEAARMLAQRVMTEEKQEEARIERAFRLVLSRAPSEAELGILGRALERHLTEYRSDPAAAKKLLQTGEANTDPKLEVADLAAYAQVCSLILNLDEAVTKE
jgi:hypothetical protein